MAAYVVVEVEVTDPVKWEQHWQMVPPSIQKYGGRLLVEGGAAHTLEGTRSPKRFAIIHFDSIERAKAWWGSPEYRDAKRLRQASARTEMFCLEGVGHPQP